MIDRAEQTLITESNGIALSPGGRFFLLLSPTVPQRAHGVPTGKRKGRRDRKTDVKRKRPTGKWEKTDGKMEKDRRENGKRPTGKWKKTDGKMEKDRRKHGKYRRENGNTDGTKDDSKLSNALITASSVEV